MLQHKPISQKVNPRSIGVKRGVLVKFWWIYKFCLNLELNRSQKPPWRLPKVAKPGNNWQCTLLPSQPTLQNNQLQNPLKGPIIKRGGEIKKNWCKGGKEGRGQYQVSIQYPPLETIDASQPLWIIDLLLCGQWFHARDVVVTSDMESPE